MKMLSKVHFIIAAEFLSAMFIALLLFISAAVLGYWYPELKMPVGFFFGLFFASGLAYYFMIHPLKKQYRIVFTELNNKCVNQAMLEARIIVLSGMLTKKEKEYQLNVTAASYLNKEHMDLQQDYDQLYEENEYLEKSLKTEKKKTEYLQLYCDRLDETVTRAVKKYEDQVKANVILSGRIFKLIDSLKELRNWKKSLPPWTVDLKKVS